MLLKHAALEPQVWSPDITPYINAFPVLKPRLGFRARRFIHTSFPALLTRAVCQRARETQNPRMDRPFYAA